MPLIDPGPPFLREKIVVIGGGGSGKTSAWLSIAWWAKQAGDERSFYVMDTDDEAVLQVMNEDKYQGLLAEEGGNVHVTSVADWADYQAFSDKAAANAKQGDWIILDFVNHVWRGAQDGYLQEAKNKSRDAALYEAGVKGATGWEQFSEAEINWISVNSAYRMFTQPIFIKSRAHVFMTSEEEEIHESRNMTSNAKDHVAQFGKWKAAGAQKGLVYQCRTFLRIQRLARGRVLYTMKDRARPEFNGETISPDFFSTYMKAAKWQVEG